MREDSLLERVTAAANERHLSQNTLTAYRRTWLKAIAWAAAEGLALETLPSERAGEFYEEATRGRSASHHLQVKAALALFYHVLGSTNPFAECPAPKFAPEKTELRYHTSSQLGEPHQVEVVDDPAVTFLLPLRQEGGGEESFQLGRGRS